MPKYRLVAEHYINDQLLAPGTEIGDGTPFPFRGAPSLAMEPLDDAARAEFERRHRDTRPPVERIAITNSVRGSMSDDGTYPPPPPRSATPPREWRPNVDENGELRSVMTEEELGTRTVGSHETWPEGVRYGAEGRTLPLEEQPRNEPRPERKPEEDFRRDTETMAAAPPPDTKAPSEGKPANAAFVSNVQTPSPKKDEIKPAQTPKK